MEKRLFHTPFLFFMTVLFFLISCSNDTVPSPEMQAITESNSGSLTEITAPQSLKASQGEKRNITLTWDSVSKATRYDIFAADTPFATFEHIGETSKTTFSYSPLAAGTTKYIKVRSVDYEENYSSFTNAVAGTTLAQPIISDITTVSGQEDSALIIWWYMENADFYKDELEYKIICKDSDGKVIADPNVHASELESNSFKIDDLKPSESYVYSVTAFLSSNPTATEVSLEVDAETARRMRPNPPEDLSSTEGTEKTSVKLSFKLPEKVDVLVAAKTYEQYPLYFKIYRRLSGTEDWGSAIVSHLYFTGDTEKPENLDFEDYDKKRTKADYFVTWEDTSVTRGVKYDYKVQSYADNTTRIITSDLSSGETTGWAAAIPKFEAKSEFTANDEGSSYTSAKISFTFDWETYGTDSNWKALLKTVYAAGLENLDRDSATTTYGSVNTIEDIKAFSEEYDLTDSTKEGYYKYSLIIVKAEDATEASESTAANAFIEIPCTTTFFLTSVVNQPKLETFALTDGYVSENKLSWLYEENTSYTLERKTLDIDGTVVADSTKSDFTFDFSSVTNDETFDFTDSDEIESGKIYSYTLYATIIENSEPKKFPSAALTAKTLGTPAPIFDGNALAYDSISVTWNEVQKAESYEVVLFDGTKQLGETETLDSEKITELSTAGVISYKISNPVGYDDATISGKALTLKVKAIDSVASVESATPVRTMGPAAIELTASKATDSTKITVEWNKTNGASGYILQRVRYDIPKEGSETAQRTDLFYVGSDGSVVYGENPVSDSAITVTENAGKITLTDVQNKDLKTNIGYETSQKLISSGLPFEYTVVPILSFEDFADFDSFTVNYSKLDELAERGSTKGFGQNISASKADFTDKVKITWNYSADGENLQPTVYRRTEGTSNFTALDTLEKRTVNYEDSITDTNIYEYVVKYGNADISDASDVLSSIRTNKQEQENCGYAFRLDSTSFIAEKPAQTSTTFEETVSWSLYDTEYRKVGPSSYTIYSKNLNNSEKWFEVAKIAADGTVTTLPTAKDWYDVTMTVAQNNLSLSITPNGILTGQTRLLREGGTTNTAVTGTHNGLLKVQRDYKHYYKFEMTRESESEGTVTFAIGDDNSKYTYRNISDDEFCKNISLIVADALYQTGIPDGSTSNTVAGNKGKFAIKHPGASKTVHWGTDAEDYQHIFKQLPGLQDTNFISGYTILMSKVEARGSVDGHILYHLPWNGATVKHETGLPSYQGYCWFSVGEQGAENIFVGLDGVTLVWDCCIQYSRSGTNDTNKLVINNFNNDTSYNDSYDKCYTVGGNKTLFYTWFPYDIGTEHKSSDTSVNTSFPEYTGTWWEVKQ